MTKTKFKRLLDKALECLGLVVPKELKSDKDLESYIQEKGELIEQLLQNIEEAQELIEVLSRDISNLEALKRQIEIEEYKELNPHAKDIFYT